MRALRARVRGGPGHLRPDDRRPRLRLGDLAGAKRLVHGIGMRFVRRLRTSLSHLHPDGEIGNRAGPGRAQRNHHLRILRRGLLLQGRDEGQRSGEDGAQQGRDAQPWPFMRQGPLRMGLRDPSRSHHQADGPREHRPALARGDVGRGDQYACRRSAADQARAAKVRPLARSAESPPRDAPTRKPTWCRSWCAPRWAPTTSIPAPACAIRQPATD